MEQVTSPTLSRSALIITICIFIGLTFGIALDFNLALPVILFGGVGLFILFNERPLVFFALLLIARMSLDYSSQFVTITIKDFSFSLSQILGLAIALLGIYVIYLYHQKCASFPLNRAFGLLVLWGALTLPYSLSPSVSVTEIIRIFDLYTISLLAYLFVKKQDDFRTLLVTLLVSGIAPGLVALYQYFNHIGFVDADVSIPRIFGTFAHPNTLSLYLFTLLVVWLLYFRLFLAEHKNLHTFSPFLYIALFLILGLLFLTFARVAWVITFLFVFILTFFRYPRLLVPLIITPLFLILVSSSFQDRIAESLSPDPDSSIVWRQTLWADVITKNIQDDRILIGSGINTFPLFTNTVRESLAGSNDAHNDFVKFYIEGGVIGLSVLILFYFLLMEKLLTLKKRLSDSFVQDITLILLTFTACLILASLSDNIFKNTPVMWIYFALFGALLSLTHTQVSLTKK